MATGRPSPAGVTEATSRSTVREQHHSRQARSRSSLTEPMHSPQGWREAVPARPGAARPGARAHPGRPAPCLPILLKAPGTVASSTEDRGGPARESRSPGPRERRGKPLCPSRPRTGYACAAASRSPPTARHACNLILRGCPSGRRRARCPVRSNKSPGYRSRKRRASSQTTAPAKRDEIGSLIIKAATAMTDLEPGATGPSDLSSRCVTEQLPGKARSPVRCGCGFGVKAGRRPADRDVLCDRGLVRVIRFWVALPGGPRHARPGSRPQHRSRG